MSDHEVHEKQPTKEDDVLRLARERFNEALSADEANDEAALNDLEFIGGDQWDASVISERKADGRPALTINRLGQSVRQVTGDIRINRPAIKVRPAGGEADKDLAETFTGLIRNIEQASKAKTAYVTAAEGAARCGIGHFRIVTEYSDNDGFELDIRLKRIRNPMAVKWDPSAEEQTKEDARYCFYSELIPKAEFKARWPKAAIADFESGGKWVNDWRIDERVRVAEYWLKVPVKKRLGLTHDGQTMDITDLKGWAAMDWKRTREVDSHKVVQYLISGADILEGPKDWAGRYLPFVPVVGEEIHQGETTLRHGVIRFAKDPQRLYNYWQTAAAEVISLAPKAPFTITKVQIKGHKVMWQQANRTNRPYLTYNADKDAPGSPKRERPADLPLAMIQMAGIAADDIKAATGIHDASLGAKSNETSGKAIEARKVEGDVGTFLYADNLATAIEHGGRILVDLIPKIYDTERAIRVLGEDDAEDFVTINQEVTDPQTGEVSILNDLSVGQYDVAVSTGPSYTTKRQEAAEFMMEFVRSVPDQASAVMDLVVKNMDVAGADELAKRFKKLLPPGLLDPDDPDAPEAPEPEEPDPLMMAKVDEAIGKSEKAAAEVDKIVAETEGRQLENAQLEVDLSAQIDGIQGLVVAAVRDTLAQILAPPEPLPNPGLIPGPTEPGLEPGFSLPGAGDPPG